MNSPLEQVEETNEEHAHPPSAYEKNRNSTNVPSKTFCQSIDLIFR